MSVSQEEDHWMDMSVFCLGPERARYRLMNGPLVFKTLLSDHMGGLRFSKNLEPSRKCSSLEESRALKFAAYLPMSSALNVYIKPAFSRSYLLHKKADRASRD
jgi:hypothetical protein